MEKRPLLNQNLVNTLIDYNDLSIKEMKDLGFQLIKDCWVFQKDLTRKHRLVIVLPVTHNQKYMDIVVLDNTHYVDVEYDYDGVLLISPHDEYALMIKSKVEDTVQFFHDKGLITGFHKGMKI